MAEPRTSHSLLPEVPYSGRFIKANDRWRDVVLTLGMVIAWLGGFALWIACWRYGRDISGGDGLLIRFVSFCACGFHVVSMGIIRAWIDRLLVRAGW